MATARLTSTGFIASHAESERSSITPKRWASPSASKGRKARNPLAAAMPIPAKNASSSSRCTGPPSGERAGGECRARRTRGATWRRREREAMLPDLSCTRGGVAVTMPVSTWVEVDLDRFAANLAAVRGLEAPGQQILLVVKADAYGHGAVEIAEEAEREGVAHLGVATLHEGIQLRRAGSRLPIVALSPLLPSEIDEAVAHDLSPTVCDLEFARGLSAAAVRAGRPIRFHVEVDTGMGRTGVREDEAEAFLDRVVAMPGLRLASLYTHFPDADAESLEFSERQVRGFLALGIDSRRAGSIRRVCMPRTARAR